MRFTFTLIEMRSLLFRDINASREECIESAQGIDVFFTTLSPYPYFAINLVY